MVVVCHDNSPCQPAFPYGGSVWKHFLFKLYGYKMFKIIFKINKKISSKYIIFKVKLVRIVIIVILLIVTLMYTVLFLYTK